MKLNRFIVVISACRGTGKDDVYAQELEDYISKCRYSYDKVEGCWRGVKEAALAVQINDFTDVGKLLNLARENEQESILLVDARQRAFLLQCNGSELENLGYMTCRDTRTDGLPHPLPDSYTVNGHYMYFTY